MVSVFRSSVRLGPFVQGWALVVLRDVRDCTSTVESSRTPNWYTAGAARPSGNALLAVHAPGAADMRHGLAARLHSYWQLLLQRPLQYHRRCVRLQSWLDR